MAEQRKNDDEIGALWIKSSSRGEYMTGTINGERVVVFKNGNKRGDKSPDWRVLRSKAREQANTAPADDFDPNPF